MTIFQFIAYFLVFSFFAFAFGYGLKQKKVWMRFNYARKDKQPFSYYFWMSFYLLAALVMGAILYIELIDLR